LRIVHNKFPSPLPLSPGGRGKKGEGACSSRNVEARIVSFVAAASNSGKTTLIEKIVPLLKARGLRVAVVKHAHAGFETDRPGKDSRRFREAGADAVMLIGPDGSILMETLQAEPYTDLEFLVRDFDIVIQEGFKKTAKNRIEVFRAGVSGEQPLCMTDPSFVALVSDIPIDTTIPRFDINDINGITEYLIANFVDPSHT
jgi:molybdopterin-guanine dinucleotide biosynthesis protein B